MKTLAQRLMACPRFRWMLGMGVENPNGVPHRIVVVEPPPLGTLIYQKGRGITGLLRSEVPDLTDPATLGCLLALVREAHGDPSLYCTVQLDVGYPWWVVCDSTDRVVAGASTEAEALVAALEAA